MQNGEATFFTCTRCGRFEVSRWTADALEREQPKWWFRLSAWLREQPSSSRTWPKLKGPLEEIEAWLPTRGVRDQMDMLLRIIDKKTSHYGDRVLIDCEELAPLVWARGVSEVCYLIGGLEDAKRIDAGGGGAHVKQKRHLGVTIGGYLHLEELNSTSVKNDQVFVAMHFAPELTPAYDRGFLLAIEAVGYRAYRIDHEPAHAERIDAKIMVDIRRSRALVADATNLRPNVMFEAGFAAGLSKPVIWTVREDQVGQLPFDTRQFLHLPWKDVDDLRTRLEPIIEDRLGRRG